MPRKANAYQIQRHCGPRLAGMLSIAFALGLVSTVFAAQPDSLRLDPPVLTDGILQLPLTGESGIEYIVETSTDLTSWLPIATNSDSQIYRTFDLGQAVDRGYFRAWRKPLPTFSAAIATVNKIDLKGFNFQTDSFDSADPLYSTNGLYPFGSLPQQKDNGHVITDSSVTNSLGVGSTKIKGMVRTGPTGSVAVTTNFSIGSKSWVEGNTNGIQPGYVLNDMNVVFPIPTLPPGFNPVEVGSAGVVNGVAYDRILTNGDFYLTSVGGSSGINKIYVSGNARLLIQSSVSMSGSDVIRIATNNASLNLYMLGGSASFGGQGVTNGTGKAANFYYFGLAGNTNVSFGGNVSFTAVICAPYADFTLGGGGSSTYNFVGSSITRSLKLNGNFYFHFDEDLMRTGPKR